MMKALRALGSLVRDLNSYWSFDNPAEDHHYRGIYGSHAAATAAMPAGQLHGFDHASVPELFIDTYFVFNPNDYAILFWLSKIVESQKTVFDLGGGIGQCYYLYEQFLRFPQEFRWVVCEVPAFVERGRSYAAERNASQILFTSGFEEAAGAGVLLSNGALQYIEADLGQMLAGLERLPRHVLVNRIPLYQGRPYYTVQRSRHSYVPYKVMNHTEFVRAVEELGYEKIDQWYLPRSLRVPFHAENFVPHYWGLYFRLRD